MAVVRSVYRWCVERSIPTAVSSSAFAVAVLLGGPLLLHNRPTHRFLLWNLALAWVPYVSALALERFHRARRRVAFAIGTAVWVLFLPNAFYLVSDLTHFDRTSA